MGDVEAGGAGGFLGGPDLGAGLLPQLGIKVREGFVQQERGRPDHQRAGQRHALLLAAGEHVDAAIAELLQTDLGQGLVDPLGFSCFTMPRTSSP